MGPEEGDKCHLPPNPIDLIHLPLLSHNSHDYPHIPQPIMTILALCLTYLTFFSCALGAWTDQGCVDACSEWSVTLGYCRGFFGATRKSTHSDRFG